MVCGSGEGSQEAVYREIAESDPAPARRLDVGGRSLHFEEWGVVELGRAPCHRCAKVRLIHGTTHWANR